MTPTTPPAADAGAADAETSNPPAATAPAEAARRLIESVVIAVVTSTGVYLVGSVYTDAYFGRMSIDAAALDLPPPFVALQAVHALQSLLPYPVLLLILYFLYRLAAARLPRIWEWANRPAGSAESAGSAAWPVLLIVNGLVALPLVLAAAASGADRALIQTNSALSEVASLMQFTGLVLIVYVVWLSLGKRAFLISEVRRRRVLPIVLLAALYLLGALVNTADRARGNAERLMTGVSDTSVAISFTMGAGEAPAPSAPLLLVAIRNGHYFMVERQPVPPSRTPAAYAIPTGSVDLAHMERVNPAAPASKGIVIEFFPSDSKP